MAGIKPKLHLAKKPKFSVILLLVFVFAFTVLGVYIIFRTFAYSTSDILKSELYSTSGKQIERINTNTNEEMAVAMSKKSFPTTQPDMRVLITNVNSWQDTNAAAVLAHTTNSSLLLSGTTTLGTLTRGELTRLKPVKITIVAATGGISDSVVNELKALLPAATIDRLSGTDSYNLSMNIANRVYENRPPTTRLSRDAFLIDGTNYAYAIGVVGVATSKDVPIIYINPTAIFGLRTVVANTNLVKGYLVPTTTITVDSVKYVPQVTTIASPDRYTLSINAANFGINTLGVRPQFIGVASGIESVNPALLATYTSRNTNGTSLVVLMPYTMGTVTANFFNAQKSNISKIVVSSKAINISSATYMKLAGYIGYTFTSSQISAQDILDARIKMCPILVGSTVDFGDAAGYQAVAYFMSGKIIISPTHTASITTILNHEIYHIYDYRQNNKLDYYENIPQPGWDCVP